MRVKDVGHKDKGVEERIKKFEDHVATQLTRGKREGPKEKKQRDDLNAERDALWQPVIRLADLLEPPVQRCALVSFCSDFSSRFRPYW